MKVIKKRMKKQENKAISRISGQFLSRLLPIEKAAIQKPLKLTNCRWSEHTNVDITTVRNNFGRNSIYFLQLQVEFE